MLDEGIWKKEQSLVNNGQERPRNLRDQSTSCVAEEASDSEGRPDGVQPRGTSVPPGDTPLLGLSVGRLLSLRGVPKMVPGASQHPGPHPPADGLAPTRRP